MSGEPTGETLPPEVVLQLRLHAAAGVFLRLLALGQLLARDPEAALDTGGAALERLRQVLLELARDGTVSVAGDLDQLVDVQARCGHEDWRRHTVAFIAAGQVRPLRLLSAGPSPAEDYSPGGINGENAAELLERVHVAADLAVRLLSLVPLLPNEPVRTPGGRMRLLLRELAQELHDAALGPVEEAEAAYRRQWTEGWTEQTRAFLVEATPRPAGTAPPLPQAPA